MNTKFFNLPIERQKCIINAGYKVFAENTYKKAPMSVIAYEADISKSLLFHYFKNKKEYYLFLCKSAMEKINDHSIFEYGDNKIDLFNEISKIIGRKIKVISKHPNIYHFIYRVYYESEESLQEHLNIVKNKYMLAPFLQIINNADKSKFRNEDDIEQLLNIIIWSAEGYIYQNIKLQTADIKKVSEKYQKVLDSLKKYYYKEE